MPESHNNRAAVFAGLGAYFLWGCMPALFIAIYRAGATPWELLGQRALWAAPWAALLVVLAGQHRQVVAVFTRPRVFGLLCLSTLLIALNWVIYVKAVADNHNLEASLGYYINPLVSVLLGIVLLGERLTPLMKAAVVAAAAGVTWLAVDLGQLPWISLVLAFSFGTYGLLRKIAPVGALIGLTVETLLLAPLAAAYLGWAVTRGQSGFVSGGPGIRALLLFAGPVTVVPLLCFAAAARRLPLSTMGFLQYLSPTLQFLLAVAVYGEKFSRGRAGAFACIWVAVAIFAFDSVRRRAPEPVVDA